MQEWITHFMEQFGYIGIFLMILLENIFPPIPSEIVLTFGGFMTTRTQMSIPGVILYATAGSLSGACVLYLIGRVLNVERLEMVISRWGHLLRLKTGDVRRADAWFDRYGYRAVFFCRMVPLVRSLISIPAGMSGMRFSRFLIYSAAGTLIWNVLLVSAGALLGRSWEKVLAFMDVYAIVAYVVIGAAVLFFIVRFIIRRRR